MRIAVITCESYRDAWAPFKELFAKFWPDCPYWIDFYSNQVESETWCQVVERCAQAAGDEPTMIFQEDFFLTVPVQHTLILRGLQLLKSENAGCVRLYPSPGADTEIGDPYYGIVSKGTPYRISCHASIWDPHYLSAIASQCRDHGEAGDFEHGGTQIAETIDRHVLAFKYNVRPWPLDYLASAIARGHWNPDALKLCREHGIVLDSKRPVAKR